MNLLGLTSIGRPYFDNDRFLIAFRRWLALRLQVLVILLVFILGLLFAYWGSAVLVEVLVIYHDGTELNRIILTLQWLSFLNHWSNLQIFDLDILIIRLFIDCVWFNVKFKSRVYFINFIFAFAQIQFEIWGSLLRILRSADHALLHWIRYNALIQALITAFFFCSFQQIMCLCFYILTLRFFQPILSWIIGVSQS